MSSSTKAPGATNISFIDAIKERRTIYALTDKSSIPDDKLLELVYTAANTVPSAFNSQTTRMVVVLRDDHRALWDLLKEVNLPITPEDKREYQAGRFKGFHDAFGTILFYEDTSAISAMQSKNPPLREKFGQWAQHTAGMHQFTLWTALEAEGLGANLQHILPAADSRVAEKWGIPSEWAMTAQLVFGEPKPDHGAQPKPKQPLEQRVMVFGKQG